MRTAAIIAEYNPFHNGHQYQLEETRRSCRADYVIIAMSGDFVQRGGPAICDKFIRTHMALLGGADLVIELPVFGSLSAAADFARCGVSLLNHTGVVDFLSFGSECGNLLKLSIMANDSGEESTEESQKIRLLLKEGIAYPKAYAMSKDVPVSPNDILGVEYLKALKESCSSILPYTLKRNDPGYHSEEADQSFASATAARKALREGNHSLLSDILPSFSLELLAKSRKTLLDSDDFSAFLNYKLLTASKKELAEAMGMPEDLANKLYKNRLEFLNTDALTLKRKDRQYTYARVSRCLMNLTLGLTKEDQTHFHSLSYAPWIRILGFKKSASPLLSALKKNCDLPILSKTADAKVLLSPDSCRLFEKHLNASEIYRLAKELKSKESFKNEFTRSPVILP